MSERMDSAKAATHLAMARAAREVVPSDPDLTARWHRHGVPSAYSRWNYHPEYEVHLITAGTGWFVVGDCIDIFTAGQLVLVGSNVPHHWISDLAVGETLPERDVVFQFHPDWVRACTALLPEFGQLEALLRRSRRGIEFHGEAQRRAGTQLLKIGETAGVERLASIFGLLSCLSEASGSEARLLGEEWSSRTRDHESPHSADRIDLAFAYIFDHLSDPGLRRADAAQHVGLSESAFSRYFSRVSGHAFSDTVRRLRLTQAGKLLRTTDLPVDVIAHRVGYANLSNFNRQFRGLHACTPREHRAGPVTARPAGNVARTTYGPIP